MRPLYSIGIFQGRALTGTTSIVLPEGFTWVVRDIDVYMGSQPDGAEGVVGGNELQAFFWFNTGALSAGWVPWRGRQVFAGGSTIAIDVTVGNADVTISGYRLTNP